MNSKYPYVIEIPCRHYQTRAIVKRVHTNPNDNWVIRHKITEYEDVPTSEDFHDLADKLDRMFDSGYELIMHTTTLEDDEGGPCYQAYLVKPDYKALYLEGWSKIDMSKKNQFAIYDMAFISNNPEKITIVWAGAC